MSPAPLQEKDNEKLEDAGSKQRPSTTGTIPKASTKTNRQRMSTMAADAASANGAGGGSMDGFGEDSRARVGAAEPAVANDGDMRYVFGDSDQDHHHMPPPMADLSTERLRIRQDNLPLLHHQHRHHLQQQPTRTKTAEHITGNYNGGNEVEEGSIGLAGRRRHLLDSVPSQQILMVSES